MKLFGPFWGDREDFGTLFIPCWSPEESFPLLSCQTKEGWSSSVLPNTDARNIRLISITCLLSPPNCEGYFSDCLIWLRTRCPCEEEPSGDVTLPRRSCLHCLLFGLVLLQDLSWLLIVCLSFVCRFYWVQGEDQSFWKAFWLQRSSQNAVLFGSFLETAVSGKAVLDAWGNRTWTDIWMSLLRAHWYMMESESTMI